MWNATVLSLFPEMFPGTLGSSLAGKALKNGLWNLNTINIRDFANNKNGKVDDVPFGGGHGMVINPEVLVIILHFFLIFFAMVYLNPLKNFNFVIGIIPPLDIQT